MSPHLLFGLAQRRGLVEAGTSCPDDDEVAALRACGLDERAITALREDIAAATRTPEIPGYRIDGLLGVGAHSVVWRATQQTLDRPVALKVVTATRARDVETFLRESWSAGATGSSYVVGCHETGRHGDALFLALELMPGGDCEALARSRGGRLPLAQALDIIRDAARGLQALHGFGLVHRDMKPANILLDAEGRGRVGDLGLVRNQALPSAVTADGTRTSALEGTPAFLAPERIHGKPADARSDIYSLGITLITLLVGHPPFPGLTAVDVLAAIVDAPAPDLVELLPEAPAALRTVLQVATARDPHERYATAAQFADDLESVAANRRPVHAQRLRQDAFESTLARPAVQDSGAVSGWRMAVGLVAGLLAGAALGYVLRDRGEEDADLAAARVGGERAAWEALAARPPASIAAQEAGLVLAVLDDRQERAAALHDRLQGECDRLRRELEDLRIARERLAVRPRSRPVVVPLPPEPPPSSSIPPDVPAAPVAAAPVAVVPGPDGSRPSPIRYCVSTVAGQGAENRLQARTVAVQPTQVAILSERTLLVLETRMNRIRRLSSTDGLRTWSFLPFAGNGIAGGEGDGGPACKASFNQPTGIAVGTHGEVYVADTRNHRIRVIDPQSGSIRTCAGDGTTRDGGDEGPALQASIVEPELLTLLPDGSLVVSCGSQPRLRRIDAQGIIHHFAGVPPGAAGKDAARLPVIDALASDGHGTVFIATMSRPSVHRIVPGGRPVLVAGTGTHLAGKAADGGPATSTPLGFVLAIACDPQGRLLISEADGRCIRRVGEDGRIRTVVDYPDNPYLRGFIVDPRGTLIGWTSTGIAIVPASTGAPFRPLAGSDVPGASDAASPSVQGELGDPSDAVRDGEGNLIIADTGRHQIIRLDPRGDIATIVETGLQRPSGLAWGPDRCIYIADSGNNRICRLEADGWLTPVAGTGVAGFGGDQRAARNALLSDPRRIVFDRAGNLFIADRSNHRIRRVDTQDIITTVAGCGTRGSAGDGGPALQAQFEEVIGLACDSDGTLYTAERSGGRIRRIDPQGIITAVTGQGTRQAPLAGESCRAIELAPRIGIEGLCLDADHALVYGSDRLLIRIAPDGTARLIAGRQDGAFNVGDGGDARDAAFGLITGVCPDGRGGYFIVDRSAHAVRQLVPAER